MILACRLLLPARGILVQSQRRECRADLGADEMLASAMPLTELLQFAQCPVHSTYYTVHSE